MSDPSAGLRLLVSDIDGTLAAPDKTLTPRTIEAVTRLGFAHIDFTVISSRPPRGMKAIVETLNIRAPFAAFNGANIVDPHGKVLQAHRLSAPAAAEAIALLSSGGVDVWVFADGAWFLRDPLGANVEREKHTVGFDPTIVETFDGVIDRIDKIVGVSDHPDRLSAAQAEAGKRVAASATVERSQSYYLDITHPKANKGDGVRSLAQMIGIALNQTAVIGDMTNDVAMFDVAGFSIAMGQAPDAVKARADVVTRSNAEEGFAVAVEDQVLFRAPNAIA